MVNEAEGVAERIDGVETAFAPWLGLDCGVEALEGERFGAEVESVQVFDGEIEMFLIGSRVEIVAVGAGIEAGEDHWAAVEVVTAGRDARAGGLEEGGIEGGGGGDVGNGEDDAVEVYGILGEEEEIEPPRHQGH